MGKKKQQQQQQHATQSFGQMVSRAALTQLAPDIQRMVNNLGQNLASQTAQTYELLFSRLVVLERIAMEKFGLTEDDLKNKFADYEDERDGLTQVDEAAKGDTVRIEIQTKMENQKEYQGITKLKLTDIGSGANLGAELENLILGMKSGDTKESAFGQDGKFQAKIRVNRVARPIASAKDETSSTDQQPVTAETDSANTDAAQ